MSLIDEPSDGVNVPEYSVSEISGAVKRAVEGGFGHVRVRGEICNLSRPRSGHVYLGLKDEGAVLAGVIWRASVRGLAAQPEEGMEVVATGRLTTYPGQSKYQMVIEDIAPAGVGALMAMLEKRRQALAAEGLFEAARKKPLPYLPRVIGVVTSPSGAVIRDILHRLSERFPVHVLVWPCAVQGKECAPQVAAAIAGFCRIPPGVAPRPDVIIVARGGGSVEDLWGFNEEIVVRAVADCPIPVISAVGHETDTTLIDHAADRRAPTPTAAAEMAVPVRRELVAVVAGLEARRLRAVETALVRWRQRLTDLRRALPRAEAILAERRQRLDLAASGLPSPALMLDGGRAALGLLGARLAPALHQPLSEARLALHRAGDRLRPALSKPLAAAEMDLHRLTGRLRPTLGKPLSAAELGLDRLAGRLRPAMARSAAGAALRLSRAAGRLAPGRLRERVERLSERLAAPGGRLLPAAARLHRERAGQLAALTRMLRSLGPQETLARGFAIVRDAEGRVLPRAEGVTAGAALELQFADGRRAAVAAGGAGPARPEPRARSRATPGGDKQGSLF